MSEITDLFCFDLQIQLFSANKANRRTVMEDTLLVLYCLVDEFCRAFLPEWEAHLLQGYLKQRRRKTKLSPAEIMTICLHFHQSHYRTFNKR